MDIVCKVDGCARQSKTRGWCNLHYARWRRLGDPGEGSPRQTKQPSYCSVEDCGREVQSNSLCQMHHKRWKNNGDPTICRPARDKICSVENCELPHCAKGYCRKHHSRWKKYGDPLKTRRTAPGEGKPYKNSGGYTVLPGKQDHPNAYANGTILEHTFVMAEILGRPLYPGENVHHKNGVRDDNRPENLELWVTSQPSGQRPEDLVIWAEEILRRYKKES